MKHWTISAKSGHDVSLNRIRDGFNQKKVSKAEYAEALRGYKHSLDEMWSEQREKAKRKKVELAGR